MEVLSNMSRWNKISEKYADKGTLIQSSVNFSSLTLKIIKTLVNDGLYASRSEYVRVAVREKLEDDIRFLDKIKKYTEGK